MLFIHNSKLSAVIMHVLGGGRMNQKFLNFLASIDLA